LSESDDFDRIFEEMISMTERLLNGNMAGSSIIAKPERLQRDELMVGDDSLTYILEAPGYEKDELGVSVSSCDISVRGRDLETKKTFPVSVDPSSAKIGYNNGVLSVRVRRRK